MFPLNRPFRQAMATLALFCVHRCTDGLCRRSLPGGSTALAMSATSKSSLDVKLGFK